MNLVPMHNVLLEATGDAAQIAGGGAGHGAGNSWPMGVAPAPQLEVVKQMVYTHSSPPNINKGDL